VIFELFLFKWSRNSKRGAARAFSLLIGELK
jgi:hypothetical protein